MTETAKTTTRETTPTGNDAATVYDGMAPSTVGPILESQVSPSRYDRLTETLEKVADRHGLVYKGRRSVPTVAKLLTSSICERQAAYLLSHPSRDNGKFDALYREKSQYATVKILDHLKTRLIEHGLNVSLATEDRDEFGVYDVTIVQGEPCSILQKGERKVRLEIKASGGLPLEQVERYLWETSPLIVVRVIQAHVAVLRPLDLHAFVDFSMGSILDKANRLMEKKGYMVPGNYCSSCPDIACSFNKHKEAPARGMIKMKDVDFGDDLNSFFANLPYVAERTASIVIQELNQKPMDGTHDASTTYSRS